MNRESCIRKNKNVAALNTIRIVLAKQIRQNDVLDCGHILLMPGLLVLSQASIGNIVILHSNTKVGQGMKNLPGYDRRMNRRKDVQKKEVNPFYSISHFHHQFQFSKCGRDLPGGVDSDERDFGTRQMAEHAHNNPGKVQWTLLDHVGKTALLQVCRWGEDLGKPKKTIVI